MNNILDFITNNKNYFEDYITRSTYHSNGIEGSTLTYADTYAILFNDNSFRINGEPREIYEAINHKYAFNIVINFLKKEDTTLTENFIKRIGVQINKNIKDISGYRKVQVFINGAEHIPPKPSEINTTMMYLVHNYNHDIEEDIFKKIALFHKNFERCHPFEDGNGRTGRLLINYELIRNNLAPIVIPKEERSKYFELLSANNATSIDNFADFLRKLCQNEMDRMEQFGYLKQ